MNPESGKPRCIVKIGRTKVADKGGHNKKEAKQSAVSAALSLLLPEVVNDWKKLEDDGSVLKWEKKKRVKPMKKKNSGMRQKQK